MEDPVRRGVVRRASSDAMEIAVRHRPQPFQQGPPNLAKTLEMGRHRHAIDLDQATGPVAVLEGRSDFDRSGQDRPRRCRRAASSFRQGRCDRGSSRCCSAAHRVTVEHLRRDVDELADCVGTRVLHRRQRATDLRIVGDQFKDDDVDQGSSPAHASPLGGGASSPRGGIGYPLKRGRHAECRPRGRHSSLLFSELGTGRRASAVNAGHRPSGQVS